MSLNVSLSIALHTLISTSYAMIDILLIAVLIVLGKEFDKDALSVPIMLSISGPFLMHLYPVLIRSVTLNYTEIRVSESAVAVYKGIIRRDAHFESVMVGSAILACLFACTFTMFSINRMVKKGEFTGECHNMRRTIYSVMLGTMLSIFAHNQIQMGARFYWNVVTFSIILMTIITLIVTLKIRNLADDPKIVPIYSIFKVLVIFECVVTILILPRSMRELEIAIYFKYMPLEIAQLDSIPRLMIVMGIVCLPPYSTRLLATLKSCACCACCCLKSKINENRDSKEKDVESCNQNEKTISETSTGTDIGPPPSYSTLEKQPEAPELPPKEPVLIVA
ncbi:hypothetical protein WR25_07515 [Diploscapter pachys]|uniref:Uncharacterized protein n=1 Tax=Diploscapter pachys TaxID=2018661 RepID=A0A2A2JKP5_9BILA|nr:hypothetical protein WR25_07515 [Diploscapter pachys]